MKSRFKLKGSGIYVNDDVTRIRAQIGYKVRALKRNELITDSWTYGGIIYAKCKNNKVIKLTTESQYQAEFGE